MSNKNYTVTVNEKEFEVTFIDKDCETISFSILGNVYNVSVAAKAAPVATIVANQVNQSTPRVRKNTDGPAIIRAPMGAERSPLSSGLSNNKTIISPMPGIVAKVLVKVGEEVNLGQPLIIIEAMKMENVINAPSDGVILELLSDEGSEVKKNQVLIELR